MNNFYVFYNSSEFWGYDAVQKVQAWNIEDAKHFFNLKFNLKHDFIITKVLSYDEYERFLARK